MLLGKLAALGLAGSGPIPDGTVVPTDAIAAINAGRYVKVPVLAGNTRDEAKLFPTFLALSPALGGKSGRLVSDAHAVRDPVHLPARRAAARSPSTQWIPADYLPVDDAGHRLQRRAPTCSTAIFFIASRDNMLPR